MSEIAQPNPNQLNIIPPSGGESVVGKPEIGIMLSSFEEAETKRRALSDSTIEAALADDMDINGDVVGIKGYLDKVETTPRDDEIIDSPEMIAGLYLATTEVVARNLKIHIPRTTTPEKRAEVMKAKDDFTAKLHDTAGPVADSIVGWGEGKIEYYPAANAGRYVGLKVDGKDILDAAERTGDFRPNIRVQRQAGGTFIVGYTDKRVMEKVAKRDEPPARRIYLNPDFAMTPAIFERVLVAANEGGLSLQLKMLQRSTEAANAHGERTRGKPGKALRGDGIVIYASEEEANDVLGLVLAIAQDSPEAFAGRKTSKIAVPVADGIGVGDETTKEQGGSLTEHRALLIQQAVEETQRALGITEGVPLPPGATHAFRVNFAKLCEAQNVDPSNIAFNKARQDVKPVAAAA